MHAENREEKNNSSSYVRRDFVALYIINTITVSIQIREEKPEDFAETELV